MTATPASAPGSVRAGWERFWFTPTSTAPVELFRIGFGVVVTLWIVSLAPNLTPFLGPGAAVPPDAPPSGTWTVFALTGQTTWVWAVWLVGVVAALGLTVGYRTRVAAVLVFVVVVSVTRSAGPALNSGDALIRILAFLTMLMPAGSAVSVDRLRSDPSGVWTFPRRAPWALRLVQIQVSVVYLETLWEKAGGAAWRDGTAVSYATRIGDLARTPLPTAVADSTALSELMTYGTLAAELALAVLVWNRAARPWVLAVGVLLHLTIEITLDVGFFGLAMVTAYLAFVSPEAATRVLCRARPPT